MTAKQNVLIIGSGGREHALAWKIAQSPRLGQLYVAPGNPGIAAVAELVPLAATDQAGLIEFARTHDIGLTVVGPDDVLAAGMVDAFQDAGLRIFGPTQAAARIESSKIFAKDLMAKYKIPTATFRTFASLEGARAYVRDHEYPLVIKANGLALGKGVTVCTDLDQALATLDDFMSKGTLGESGASVVIEEFMKGQEVSLQVLCDGHTSLIFPTSQDHKPVGTGDVGPNTGGMGTYAPVPWVTAAQIDQIRATIIEPVLEGLARAGSPFKGLLYPGLMVGEDGHIRVVEFNARFGDPEPQSYLRLLESDLLDLLDACVDGTLSQQKLRVSGQSAVNVVMASGGYPGSYRKGLPITGIDAAEALPGVVVFQAGTIVQDGRLVTAGGRVLGVSAVADDLATAQTRAYEAVKLIHFDGAQYRTDIGAKSL